MAKVRDAETLYVPNINHVNDSVLDTNKYVI